MGLFRCQDVSIFAIVGDRKIEIDREVLIAAITPPVFSQPTNTALGRIDLAEVDSLLEALEYSEGLTIPRQKAIWILKALRSLMQAAASRSA
jgi:hypothetical protein